MKKLFTLIVAICATTLAWADYSGSCGSNVTYSFVSSTGTLTISGTGDMKEYFGSNMIQWPWSIYSGSGWADEIKEIVIENGVTGVVGVLAKEMTDAFGGCTELTSINVAEDNLNYASIDGVLYSKDKKTLIMCPRRKTGSVTIPNSVTSIGYSAFFDCTGLTSVTIPNSVTSIGEEAFEGCTGLTSVTIPNSVTSIGGDAFWNCTGLTSVTIPNSVTSIGDYAFEGVKHITYTGGATGSPWGANIVNGFIDGDFVFSDDKKTQLAAYVGNGGSVIIPDGVTSIGDRAFWNCTGLTSITIPNSVTSIGEMAFAACTGLTSVTIPNSVTSVGEWAFDGCTGLTSMTVEATNPPLCFNDYDGLAMPNYDIPLYVPAGSVNAYKKAYEWKKFTNIQVIPATGVNEATAEKSEVKKIIDRNGIIYIEKDGTRYFLNGGKAE